MSSQEMQLDQRPIPYLDSLMSDAAALDGLLEEGEVEIRGVLDVLEELNAKSVSLADPLVRLVVPERDFVAFAFWAAMPEFVRPASALLRGETTYATIIKDNFWNHAMTWLADFNTESKSTDDSRLPIAEIHSPHVGGCKGTFATTQTGSLDVYNQSVWRRARASEADHRWPVVRGARSLQSAHNGSDPQDQGHEAQE